MNPIKTSLAVLLSSVVFASVASAQEIDKVPDCATGQTLTVCDNGWLSSGESRYVASHHEILADYRQPGIPDTLRYQAERVGHKIGVCRVLDRLHYVME